MAKTIVKQTIPSNLITFTSNGNTYKISIRDFERVVKRIKFYSTYSPVPIPIPTPEPDEEVMIGIDYTPDPAVEPANIPGMETNAFGLAITGSEVPTASDFVTY